MNKDMRALQKQRQDDLEQKRKKMNKKDLRQLLAPYIIESQKYGAKDWRIVGRNYIGNVVHLQNAKEDDCLQDLAILNGITVE